MLNRQTVDDIKGFLAANPEATSADAKVHFGEKYSYGVLKMVISHMQLGKQFPADL